jgi:hypothetical protein
VATYRRGRTLTIVLLAIGLLAGFAFAFLLSRAICSGVDCVLRRTTI